MVASLGLGKFYGGSLPRPRIYADVKLNGERIDPPLSVTDPLIAWAEEAHWSMGGASTTRRRLQGRIEGNVDRLRAQWDDALFKKSAHQQKSAPSPAPTVIKRRRVVGLVDEEEEDEGRGGKLGAAGKLGENFEKLAGKCEGSGGNGGGEGGGVAAAARKRSKRKEADLVAVAKNKSPEIRRGVSAAAAAGIRSSPRLAKICSSR